MFTETAVFFAHPCMHAFKKGFVVPQTVYIIQDDICYPPIYSCYKHIFRSQLGLNEAIGLKLFS